VRTTVAHSTASGAHSFVFTTFWRHLSIYKSTGAQKNGILFLRYIKYSVHLNLMTTVPKQSGKL